MIILQFVGHLLGGSMVGKLRDPGLLQPEPQSLQQVTAGPLKGMSCSVSMGPLGPGGHRVLFETSKCLPLV